MQIAADAMPAQFPHHRIPVAPRPGLDSMRNIREKISLSGLLDAAVESFPGNVDQLADLRGNVTD